MRAAREVMAVSIAAALFLQAPAKADLTSSPNSPTSASITVSLSPDRLGARAAVTLTLEYTGGESGVPSAVRRSVLRLPAGMSLEIPKLRSCAAARLEARGPVGCPAQSELGSGHALVQARTGSQTISEDVRLWVFLGPPRNLQPTFEILGQGYAPLAEQVMFTGTVLTGQAPYGEELIMSIPPIPTLPLAPDASIVTLTLTVGASPRHRAHDQSSVRVPSRCPAGGFPFGGEFTYADGSEGSALAKVPCER